MARQQQPRDSICKGHRQRLRARYENGGMSSLSDYEFVELLLTLLIPRIDVKPIAKDLLKKFGNLRGIIEAKRDDILKVNGIGENSFLGLRIIKDAISLYHLNELELPGDEITTISKLIKYFKTKISNLPYEALELVCFDTQLRIIPNGSIRLFEGSVNTSSVDIRKIIEISIKLGASNIAIAHNHPSGNPRPSFDDIRFTRRLSEACKPINLNFIEHIIIGKNESFSFRRDGHFDDLYDNNLEDTRLRGRSKVAEPHILYGKHSSLKKPSVQTLDDDLAKTPGKHSSLKSLSLYSSEPHTQKIPGKSSGNNNSQSKLKSA